ncbi:MAG: hypothetical protein WC613_00655 [Candidatus Aenigmatarchaeota archaeon]
MYVPQGLFDADRIAKPSDREIAQYRGVDRRIFLKYVGLAGMGLLAASCGGGSPVQPTNDCRTTGCPANQSCVQETGAYSCKDKPPGAVTVTGQVYNTAGTGELSQYRITLGGTSQDVINGVYGFGLTPAVYRAKIENTGGIDFLSPMEVSVNMASAGNYDFDVLFSDATFRTFLQEVAFGGGSTHVARGPLKRPISNKHYVIDASFPQRYIDDVIKDVLLKDVPALCKGRLFSMSVDDSMIEVRASMPPKQDVSLMPKDNYFFYNTSRFANTGPASNSTCDSGYADFNQSGGRAVASQEILQLFGFWADTGETGPATLPSIFDNNPWTPALPDRPSVDDIKMGRYVFSREPGTSYPDIRP